MLQIEEAVELLKAQISQVKEIQKVSLIDAVGQILAEDHAAQVDQPPFPRSPLDGYAVRGTETIGASLKQPKQFQVIGKVYAGQVFHGTIKKGQAVRIMTGAPIPSGADTVIRQEDTDRGEDIVSVYSSSAPYENYCPQGEDYKKGDILLQKGTKLTGRTIAMLASLGIDTVRVYGKAKVAVISTGDEVIQPGEPLQPGKIYDSNRFYLCSRLAELGNPAAVSCHCGDDIGKMTELLRITAGTVDMIITTGGVSVGEKDIMHGVIAALGAETLFWKVSLKPGAPTLAAVYQGTLIVCLSGNPYGAAANFELLIRPVLEKLTGDSSIGMKKQWVKLTNNFPKKGKVRRFLRGYTDGKTVSVAERNQASGALSAMLESNCLIEIPPEQNGAKRGTEVWVYLF